MMMGLDHGHREPASSSAKTRSTEKASRRMVPRMSILAKAFRVNLLRTCLMNAKFWAGTEDGRTSAIRMRQKLPAGAL